MLYMKECQFISYSRLLSYQL